MTTTKSLIAVALVTVCCSIGGCEKVNPYYCADNPEHNCAIDAPMPDSTAGCALGCATGVCDMASQMCVQCTAESAAACMNTTPICGADDTCHACSADSQCASTACMPDGSCAPMSTVLYASAAGSDTAACTSSDMCSLDQALSIADATHDIIKLDPGMYGTGGLAVTKTVTLLGRDVTLDKNTGAHGPVIAVTTPSTTVELDYLTIQGGDDSSLGNGITCSSATLVVHDATIQNNLAMGISGQACDVTLDRLTVFNNMEGGIYLTGSNIQFDITNAFIIRNGNIIDSAFGGVDISTTIVGTSRFEFNTVADNVSATGVNHFGGVTCDIVGFVAGNNIVAQNSKNGVATAQQTQGACTFPASLIQDDESGLAFINASTAPYNYRISSSSTAKDQATAPSLVDIDNAGDFRPQGAQKDIGADEFKE